MPDYRCPACRGGFPAVAATDDACPWCGEPMDRGGDDRPELAPTTPSFGREATPFWDSGVRCRESIGGVGPLDRDTRDLLDERDVLGDRFQRDVGGKETARERMHRIADAFDSGDH